MTFECPPCSWFYINLSVPTLVFCRGHFPLFFQACLQRSSSKKHSLINGTNTLYGLGLSAPSRPTPVLMQGTHGGLSLS